MEHLGAVAIAAQASDGRLLVVRQYRASIGDWMTEIPAGRLEANEDPLDAAKRELEEETGYEAGSWSLLRSIVPAPGFASEVIHVFHATDLQEVEGGGLSCDEDEEIEVEFCSLEDLITSSRDAKSLIAALFLSRAAGETS